MLTNDVFSLEQLGSYVFIDRLSSSKQSKVYLPEPPFPHAEVSYMSFMNIVEQRHTSFILLPSNRGFIQW